MSQAAGGADALLRVRGLHKRYAAPVLTDVDLDLRAGEVHALMGANGAGKTTLSRVVCGLAPPDGGSMTLAGARYAPRDRREAERAGVQMVMQELNLVRTLTVAENLFLGRLPRRYGLVAYRRLNREAERALGTVGLAGLDPRTPVGSLGVGEQQLVEIAAALARPCRVLILDEPTAALTDPEIELLFARLRSLRAEGIGILYISHRMEEIRRISDRITVLRDGRVVGTRSAADASMDEVVRLMVGEGGVGARARRSGSGGAVALRVEGLRRGHRVRDVSFEVRHGEILGVAGLVGSGRTETLRAIFGADRRDAGRISRGAGPPLEIRGPWDAVRAGIGMVPEDRKEQALLLPQPVRVNVTLASVGLAARRGGWMDRAREASLAGEQCMRLGVQTRSVEQPVRELSGGNQQKVVMARWLMRKCDVLLFDEPTRGIDVAAKRAVYGLLEDLAAAGRALVVVSSDLPELMALCDRIAVMSAGRMAATFARGEWTEEKIMAAAFSEHAAPASAMPAAS